MKIPALSDIRDAHKLIAGHIIRTPFLPAPRLSGLTGAEVFVKYENLQTTASFKERGARTKLLSLSEAERARGVIALSAGNHAQSVACHAQRLGIRATIVMPRFTPYVKVAATRSFGATVVLEGETLADCIAVVDRIKAETGAVMVHPYDDFDVIRGQGTIGVEVAEDGPELDAFIVPIGGGGLISGIAIAMKALSPKTEIIGAQTELFPSLRMALEGREAHGGVESIAEGIAVKAVGALPLAICRTHVDDTIEVPETAIEGAISDFLTLQKNLAEGAGATGLAALLANRERFRGKKVGLVISGGNIDPRLAASIVVRALARDERIMAIRLTIADRPGVLAQISKIIGEAQGNILEVLHDRSFLNVPAKGAILDVTIETHGKAHTAEIIEKLKAAGYRVERLDPPA